MPTTTAEPVLFVLWFKPHRKGAKWQKLGRFATRAEALSNCKGSGDFHVAELHNPEMDPFTPVRPATPLETDR